MKSLNRVKFFDKLVTAVLCCAFLLCACGCNANESVKVKFILPDDERSYAVGKMYDHMIEAYGIGDDKLSSAVANYLKTVVGLTDNDINNIRSIMIQEI